MTTYQFEALKPGDHVRKRGSFAVRTLAQINGKLVAYSLTPRDGLVLNTANHYLWAVVDLTK